jgi:hypothetical protein
MISACNEILGYSSGKELRGMIVDAESGEPIPDAIVVVNWITSVGTMGGSELVCFHAGGAITNEAGEYYIPSWRQKSPFSARFDQDVLIFAHKPGYRWPHRDRAFTRYTTSKLISSQEPENKRLQYLREVNRQTYCNRADESIKALLPLRKSLLQEALAIAPEQNDPIVEYLQKSVEEIEFGFAEARRRHFERIARKTEKNKYKANIIESTSSPSVESIDHSLTSTGQ